MTCPRCHGDHGSTVTDNRSNRAGQFTWRRRTCRGCGARFTTYQAFALDAVETLDPAIARAWALRKRTIRLATDARPQHVTRGVTHTRRRRHLPDAARARLMAVTIVDPAHPHYPEQGRLTGTMITVLGTPMAEVALAACRHGCSRCFVMKGQIRDAVF